MQYFRDLSQNFDDIKKRKFVLTEHTLSTPYLSISDNDSLSTIVDVNYKHILSKYRLDKEVYETFIQTLISQKENVKFAAKDEEGILQGNVLSAKDNLIFESLNNSIKCLFLTLSRDRLSTYEKSILTNTFCTLGPVYFGVYSLGVEDLLFVFKDETNVLKSLLNSIIEKYRIQFKDYNLKEVLNFYSDRFFKNLQTSNQLSLVRIQQVYSQITNDFNAGCPIHISDLFYVDILNNADKKYTLDLFQSYADGLLQAKAILGSQVIDNDLGKIGNFTARTVSNSLESFIPREEINTYSINNLGTVNFSYKNFLVSDKTLLSSRTFKEFVNLLSLQIEDLRDVRNSFFFRKFFNLDPDKVNKILSNFKELVDTLKVVYSLPFKASVLTKDDIFVIEYPLKSLVNNIMDHMKRKCTYDEIYTNSYKSRVIILFEKFLELMEINPITENFVRGKVIEFLFLNKIVELLNKDQANGKLLIGILLVFLNSNTDDGFLNIIKTTFDKKFYLFRNLDYLNSVLKPLINGDPSVELLVQENVIEIRTYNIQTFITLSVTDLSYLQFNLTISKNSLSNLNRYSGSVISSVSKNLTSKSSMTQNPPPKSPSQRSKPIEKSESR